MYIIGFGTIRNNTALKRSSSPCNIRLGFGTIRNNTALKQSLKQPT
ncbi:conserved domain protein [Streptococcus oralis SK255]|uniref:Conserved domain protein n=1 Tax=Streptococcus oralis SK255 TaxID=1005704 RepID=F5VWH9_STROR|nr:conserved domain protein [Streptococcus oralis SK255]